MRSPSVRAPTAYFDALYMVDHGSTILPPIDPMFTTMPLWRARMCGTTSCVMSSSAKRFNSIRPRASSIGMFQEGK